MPSHPCKWPTCDEYVSRAGEYCPDHAEQGREVRAERSSFYDQHLRDPDAKRFYASAAWQHARARKLATNPTCEFEGCARFAQHVHHRKPLKDCTTSERVWQPNLESLCPRHHNEREAQVKRRSQ
ncbi:MAG TPA: hypothetical protein VGN72_07760 [Tepidisphaeraceae bacterium]|jgi:5-methylcytosine-specific restriction protein A|nr:hypothetical protein [Tepidisphaeraceae bacterium]